MIEYVASGCSFLRITYKQCLEEENKALINSFFREVDNANGHRFSLLFNALTETTYGEVFRNYKDSIYTVHADSGGLQLITQGKEVSPAIKREIYTTQAEYADIGMSFDVIPLKITGAKSKRNDLSTRFFDRENLIKYAEETGDNLREQIEVFLEKKTACQPFFIVHGNDIDSAIEWTDRALARVPADMMKHVGGIAMGGGSFGNGQKEMLLRAVLAGHILRTRDDLIYKRIHFLGLGSLTNAFPFLAMIKSGMYDQSWNISYDSTTHTSSHHMGDYLFADGKRRAFTKSRTHAYQLMYDDISANLKSFNTEEHSVKLFHKTLTSPAQGYVDGGGNFKDVLYSNLGCALSSIYNFTRKIDQYSKDFNLFLEERIPNKEWGIYQQIAAIDSVEAYREWDAKMGMYFDSKRLPDFTNTNLDGFFD